MLLHYSSATSAVAQLKLSWILTPFFWRDIERHLRINLFELVFGIAKIQWFVNKGRDRMFPMAMAFAPARGSCHLIAE